MTINPRTAKITIYDGDDLPTLTDLRRAADVAKRIFEQAEVEAEDRAGTPLRIGDDSGRDDLAAKREAMLAAQDAYDSFVDEAVERALVVELRSIGRKRFRDLMADHAPRKVMVPAKPDPDADADAPAGEREETHPDDKGYDVNTETFPAALLTFTDGDVRTIAAPEFASRGAVADFIDNDIAEGDFTGLWTAAYYLNRMPSADPFQSKFGSSRPPPSIDAT